MRIFEQASVSWQKCKSFCSNLNLFPSIPPTTDEHELRNQRLSTRLFIICLVLSLFILVSYTSLVRITKTINTKAPTLAQYSQLYATHSQTLACPCTQISINYNNLLHIQYTLHQICNSVFITQSWFHYLGDDVGITLYNTDLRWIGPYVFQGLNAFCQSINKTIADSLEQFYSNQYITASVTPSYLFQSQIQSLVDQFRSSITNNFLVSLSIIRDTTQSNGLFSGQWTNYGLYISNDIVFSKAITYSNCNCAASATCISPIGIYNYPNTSILLDVPGLYVGCFTIEALLQSNLQCFYNQTFINQLKTYLSPSLAINVTALNTSLPSQYSPNATINELLDTLMIEEWNLTLMYDQYYNECQPVQCSHSVETSNDIIYIVTTVIGIIGGLTTVLKQVVPQLVNYIMRWIRKKRAKIDSQISIMQT